MIIIVFAAGPSGNAGIPFLGPTLYVRKGNGGQTRNEAATIPPVEPVGMYDSWQ